MPIPDFRTVANERIDHPEPRPEDGDVFANSGTARGGLMTELHPWAGFDSLVDGLERLQARAREAVARSVDEILTLRNWLIGAWIVAYEQEGADRARYGEGLIDALAAAFKARGVDGLGRSNLKNYRQIALTWPTLGFARRCLANRGRPSRSGRRCLPNPYPP